MPLGAGPVWKLSAHSGHQDVAAIFNYPCSALSRWLGVGGHRVSLTCFHDDLGDGLCLLLFFPSICESQTLAGRDPFPVDLRMS